MQVVKWCCPEHGVNFHALGSSLDLLAATHNESDLEDGRGDDWFGKGAVDHLLDLRGIRVRVRVRLRLVCGSYENIVCCIGYSCNIAIKLIVICVTL